MVRSGSGPTTMPMSMSFSFWWSRQLLSLCCSVVLLKLEAKEVGFSFSQLKHDIHVFPGISMNTKIGQPSFKKNEDVVKPIYLELRRGRGVLWDIRFKIFFIPLSESHDVSNDLYKSKRLKGCLTPRQ